MKPYILGLDLGPNSIGWAMLEADQNSLEPVGFADTESAGHPPLGVRVFEAGLHNFGNAKEESLNQSRRAARSMRRNHARRNARRNQLKAQLIEGGLLPPDDKSLEDLFKRDPYELRARALTEDLEPHEIGRAIFHLGQRRGFQSNRKSGKAKEDEGILKEIGELERGIKESGCRSLGEYLFKLANDSGSVDRPRLRNRHTRRDMYLAEFEAIVSRQQACHSALLSASLVSQLRHTIFFQHPFEVTEERRLAAPSRANLHRAPSVRSCPLESGQYCCPRGLWEAQQFRIYKETANLRLSEHHSRERALTAGERKIVLDLLMAKDRVKFDDIRKALAKTGVDPEAQFNLERGGRSALLGNSVEHKLATTVGRAAWRKLDEHTRQRLRDYLVQADDPAELVAVLQNLSVDQESIEKLVRWTPADGYLGYSLEAVRKLTPLLADGLDEFTAIQKAYPQHPGSARLAKLPPLSSGDLPTELTNLTNPIVRRALVEVRKVVNALIREHGCPARIVVELAREMKDGAERRRDAAKALRERERVRDEAAIRVAEFGGNQHSRDDVNRWLIWEEQGRHCIYTGEPIPVTELFAGGEWEIDHILPRWRSLDDSQMNKVLVHRRANMEKGDRTPMEWLGEDSEAFHQLLRRASSLQHSGTLPRAKFERLKRAELDTEDFTARQLNDTRYLTRAVMEYLSLLFPPELRTGEKAIQSCRGGLTAELRRQWGLNNVLPDLYDAKGQPLLSDRVDNEGIPYKSRDDHRHHAIDAVVIALSSRALLKRYQEYWKTRDQHPEVSRPEFPNPWDAFRETVSNLASRVTVSHRALRKISGAFHEETFYGPARNRNGEIAVDRYVTRKRLDALTGSNIATIRDSVCRRLIEERLRLHGWDGESNSLPKGWHAEPIFMANGIPIRKVRIEVAIKNAQQLKHRYAILGNNHHLEIVASAEIDEHGVPKAMWATAVSTMVAADRVRRQGLPAVCRDHGADKVFVMSLARKESIQIVNPATGERIIGVIQKLTGEPQPSSRFDITIRDCRDSRPATHGNKQPFRRVSSFVDWRRYSIAKVQVDPIGRMSPSND